MNIKVLGTYYVSPIAEQLIRLEDKKNLSDLVYNFQSFSKLGINVDGGVVKLIIDTYGKVLFIRHPNVNYKTLKILDVISSDNVLPFVGFICKDGDLIDIINDILLA